MKKSSNIRRGFMILAAIAVPALSWWASWRYQAAKEAEAARIEAESVVTAKNDTSKNLSELIRELGVLNRRYEKWPQESEEMKKLVMEIKQKREEIQSRMVILQTQASQPESIEFAFAKMLPSTWNGQTDPDSLWHGQRQEANRTLMEHGLPSLEGRGAFPDSAPMTRSFIPGVEPRK